MLEKFFKTTVIFTHHMILKKGNMTFGPFLDHVDLLTEIDTHKILGSVKANTCVLDPCMSWTCKVFNVHYQLLTHSIFLVSSNR